MHRNNDGIRNHSLESYRQAEQKAAVYFEKLLELVKHKAHIPVLTADLQVWKQTHISPYVPFFTIRKKNPSGYDAYIKWLKYTGKLDNYLERSISYIFIRDLGKSLESPATLNRVRQIAGNLKKQLTTKEDSGFSMAGLYGWAKKEGLESTFIWLIGKLNLVSSRLPKGIDAAEARRKLIKIIAGVLLHAVEDLGQSLSPSERAGKLDEAIRAGYAYGLTYPFIDDLLDSPTVTPAEKKRYSRLIRTALLSGSVPELGEWNGENSDLIHSVYSELRAAFDYLKTSQNPETMEQFFGRSYVFFQAQETDREKILSNGAYTNEELYIPIILKSFSSRLMVRTCLKSPEDEGFEDRIFYHGIYNQLADDLADFFSDMEDGAVTPYTYYWKHHAERPDLLNPFEVYWTVIFYLIHHVYHSDPLSREVIFDRAVNSLKRLQMRLGSSKYDELMAVFAVRDERFNRLTETMVRKAEQVDFFDKLLRDEIAAVLKSEEREQEEFKALVETVREEINKSLPIAFDGGLGLTNNPIIPAANYSLEGEGKRLRPIIAFAMGVNGYGLDSKAIIPVFKALEYMHTASLIFDDLPSQDNAATRRGRTAVHQRFNIAVGELTGLFLTQKAVEEQTCLEKFDAGTVLKLIRYSARVTGLMCQGQAMDLGSKGTILTLEQLESLSFYKTGIAFEASLLMPAILAEAKEPEKEALKKFARHAGIAFQIKDDLLDVEGDENIIGKPVCKDAENNNSTFVSILGVEEARKQLWEHYCFALESLQGIPRNTAFLKQLLNYIVHRDR